MILAWLVTWLLKALYRVARVLTSRLVMFSIMILLQMGLLAFVLLRLSAYSLWVFAFFQVISLAVVLWIVYNEDHPSYKIAWIIFVMLLPVLGGLFYLQFGNKRISARQRRSFSDYVAQNPQLFARDEGAMELLTGSTPRHEIQARYIQRVSGFGPCANTSVEYCPLGEDQFRLMLEELEKAQSFIFLEYFIIQPGKMWDPILKILTEKAGAGVEVRLMYDDLGCIRTLPAGYHKTLMQLGIQVQVFNPFRPSIDPYMNYRDHRKLCIIDGLVGFCGGINLADEYINSFEKHGHWKDTAVMLRGDGVWNLTKMFLQVWGPASHIPCDDVLKYRAQRGVDTPGFVQPYSDTPLDNVRVAESIYLQIINRADRYVYITTPYLILDSEFTAALKIAAESGVDVRIITPHMADKWYVHMVTRSYYSLLLHSGVRIYEYTPGFIHAKMFVSDDCCAVVGTANLDYRSLYLHHECGVAMIDHPAIGVVRDDILSTLELSQEITLEEMAGRSLFVRLLSAFLRVFSPLM